MSKIEKIIKRFIVTFILVFLVLNYVNYGFWLLGASLFTLKEVFGLSMFLTLPFLPVIVDPDEIF